MLPVDDSGRITGLSTVWTHARYAETSFCVPLVRRGGSSLASFFRFKTVEAPNPLTEIQSKEKSDLTTDNTDTTDERNSFDVIALSVWIRVHLWLNRPRPARQFFVKNGWRYGNSCGKSFWPQLHMDLHG